MTLDPRSADTDRLRWLSRYGGALDFRGQRVLELGCRAGHLAALAAKHGARQALGVDAAPPDAAAGQAWTPVKLDLDADDWERPVRLVAGLPAGAPGFDWVFAFDIVENLTAPARFFAQVRGLLAPGGRLIVTTPNVGSWARVAHGASWCGAGAQHKILFTRYALGFLLQRCGFRAAVRAPLRGLAWLGPLGPQLGERLIAVAQI